MAPRADLLVEVNAALRRRAGTRSTGDGELAIRCPEPNHDDKRASATWSVTKGAGICHACAASWSTKTMAELIGVEVFGNGQSETVWDIRDRSGDLVARHHRVDQPDGSKSIWWTQPDGTKKLGRPGKSVPLYLSEKIDSYDPEIPVYICEGEKAADAAARLGLQAVATFGADVCPNPEVLAILEGFDIAIWPDHDLPGMKHRRELHDALVALEITPMFVDTVRLWGGEPSKNHGMDAADLRDMPENGLPIGKLECGFTMDDEGHFIPQNNRAIVQSLPPKLAESPSILGRFSKSVRLQGVVGECATVKLVYLGITSRLLGDPVSFAVKGTSSGGKSSVTERVVDYFPPEAVAKLTSASSTALIYTDQEFEHKTIYIAEATALRENDEESRVAYFIRTLLSEGRIDHEVTVKGKDGKFTTQKVSKKGPTNIVFTTTRAKVHAENETRIFSLNIDDSAQQTKAVFLALADETREKVDLEPWHELQSWLQAHGERRVTIPYSRSLAELVPPLAVRMRRDFKAVLSLIRAHAILHQVNRDRGEEGRIVASLEDYAAVRELIAPIVSEGVGATVSDAVRETVEAVRDLATEGGVTAAKVSKRLKLDSSAGYRRLLVAAVGGYIENLETRPRKPGRWVVGESLPGEVEVLPKPEALQSRNPGATPAKAKTQSAEGDSASDCTIASVPGGIKREPPTILFADDTEGDTL